MSKPTKLQGITLHQRAKDLLVERWGTEVIEAHPELVDLLVDSIEKMHTFKAMAEGMTQPKN